MATTVAGIERFLEHRTPRLEHELGELGFPFYMMEPEVRMRMRGACGVVSETLRQTMACAGIESEVRMQKLGGLYPGDHLITVAEGERPIIVDGSYGQLFQPFGPDWMRGFYGIPLQFPEPRVLVFEDGRQPEIAEVLAEVGMLSPHRKQTQAEVRDYFNSLWNLEDYEPYEVSAFMKETAAELRATVWPDGIV